MMKLPLRLIFFLVTVLCASTVYAEVRIYLYSSADIAKAALTVGDVATVEGPADECGEIRKITVDDQIMRDCYIDRGELSRLLKEHEKRGFFIFGSAVRIRAAENTEKEKKETLPLMIRSGESVKVRIMRKNMTVEITGRALRDAKPGEQVTVKCRGRELTGTVNDNKTVTCEI